MEWISVSERLPEHFKDVLVWVVEGKQYFENENYFAIDQIIKVKNHVKMDFRTHIFCLGKVTHWSELPQSPNNPKSE